jgi:hypothetical protein
MIMKNPYGLELSVRHLLQRDQAFTWRYYDKESQSSGPELKFVFPKHEANNLITKE